MKNNHIATAVKALKRQRDKYQNERDRFEAEEQSAKRSKEFFVAEIMKLEKQIAGLEGEPIQQKELSLT